MRVVGEMVQIVVVTELVALANDVGMGSNLILPVPSHQYQYWY